MRRKGAAIISLALASMLALSGCSTGSTTSNTETENGGATSSDTGSDDSTSNTSAGAIKDLVTYEVANREMEDVFVLHSETASDLNVLCNTNSGLLEANTQGTLGPGVAKEWGTEDNGLTWTFKLRDDVKWVDNSGAVKADCTAQDWLTALEWILNFHKNGGLNISMPCTLIEGAEAYYEYTNELSEEEALALDASEGSKFLEMVGIEAPDDYTLVYHCAYTAPYFDTVATSACLYPLSQAFVDEVGVENVLGQTYDKYWSNGAYILTEFISGNQKVLTKNEEYYDKDCTLFDTVTIRIVDDTLSGYNLYETGELDNIDLSQSTLQTIYDDESNQYHDQLVEALPKKYSYNMHFNYDKRDADGNPDTNWNTAVANEAFRLSMYYGLDLTKFWARTNYVNPLHCENNFYTMKGLVYFSDGTEYTERVAEKLGLAESDGETPRRYDAEKAEEYKKQAIEELTAAGVTFPIQIDYYIKAGSQTALDGANVLKDIFSECLGDEYVVLNIDSYVSSLTQEIVNARKQSFVINGWGADYGDVQNFLGQETYGEDGAYYSMNYSNINDASDEDLIADYKEFTELVNTANDIVDDLDARYDAYADAETYFIQHAFTIPMEYEVTYQLTHINDNTKIYALYGMQNYLYKNWETSVDAYTTEQYEQLSSDAE